MICQRVLIINEGRIVAEDTPKNLAEGLQSVERLEIEIGGPVDKSWRPCVESRVLPKLLIGPPQPPTAANGTSTSSKSAADRTCGIPSPGAVISNGWSLLSMQSVGMSLEEIFLRLTTREDL